MSRQVIATLVEADHLLRASGGEPDFTAKVKAAGMSSLRERR
ncbi:hypothetical protein [Streptomyces lavendulae]